MYNRVCIVGGSGTGKSTLAEILSKKFSLPVCHLDSINFSSNWVKVDESIRDSKILSKTNEDKWIIEGNYKNTLKQRFSRADLIVWLDYSTFAQLRGVFWRVISSYGKERPEIPGCTECIDLGFIKYVLSYNKKRRHIILDNLDDISNLKLKIFHSRKELNLWLNSLN